MPIASKGYERHSEAAHMEARDCWRPEGDSRLPLGFLRGQVGADDFYQLAGASGLAAGLSISAAFWSGCYVVLRMCMR